MTDTEVARIERAMDRQADVIGASVNKLGDKIEKVGNRVTRVETQLEDHLDPGGHDATGVGPAPSRDSLVVPWRVVITIIGALAAGGISWEGIRSLF